MNTPPPPAPNPGWYPDPNTVGVQRWWDGHAWTDYAAPADPTSTGMPQSTPSAQAARPGGRNKRRVVILVVAGLALVGLIVLIAVLTTGSSSDNSPGPAASGPQVSGSQIEGFLDELDDLGAGNRSILWPNLSTDALVGFGKRACNIMASQDSFTPLFGTDGLSTKAVVGIVVAAADNFCPEEMNVANGGATGRSQPVGAAETTAHVLGQRIISCLSRG